VTTTYPESVSNLDRDVADQPFGVRNARWRTWLRAHTPNALYGVGLVVPKARNCGNHEWHSKGHGIDACYHCEVTTSTPPEAPWFSDRFNRADDIG
jgi:hypothetical protein